MDSKQSAPVHSSKWSRRRLLQVSGWSASGAVAGILGAGRAAAAAGPPGGAAHLAPLLAKSESEAQGPPMPMPARERVGYAIVGLGHLALEQILPAFAQSMKARPVALVSGNRTKALSVASAYGIDTKSVYDYSTYDRLRDDASVQAVYIVLPNSMHAEFTVRAAQAGKHVLCEKPMATTVPDAQQMISACEKAQRRLMIAYRMQYEPYNRQVIRMVRAGELGQVRGFSAINGQAQGDPNQWRMKKALAGGGALPDVGIYCLNAARYITGEEPIELFAMISSTPNDPRFKEVEEQMDFTMRFPSGFLAACTTSYGIHDAKRYRVMGSEAWVDLDPAFPYKGQAMKVGRKGGGGVEMTEVRHIVPKNQFALELDHFAECIRENRKPHTPGEEGLQDMRIMAGLYQSAASGRSFKMDRVAGLDVFRGPPPSSPA
jgi:predicted dehydrogenase